MPDILVCKDNELADGAVRIVQHGPLQIAVIRHGGRYFACRNFCPHQGGPVCEGVRMPRVIDVVDDLPVLSEQAKRNILGGNAQHLFKLDPICSDVKLPRRAAPAAAGGGRPRAASA